VKRILQDELELDGHTSPRWPPCRGYGVYGPSGFIEATGPPVAASKSARAPRGRPAPPLGRIRTSYRCRSSCRRL